ncbi:hypothetical protein XMM354_003340 [Aliiroseovarius sp. xm-m-354]|nr:hypothetical protein [Aliiroseovarius sp. xm-m-354]
MFINDDNGVERCLERCGKAQMVFLDHLRGLVQPAGLPRQAIDRADQCERDEQHDPRHHFDQPHNFTAFILGHLAGDGDGGQSDLTRYVLYGAQHGFDIVQHGGQFCIRPVNRRQKSI